MSEEFGKRLKELRKAAGCTQGELSEKLGVHRQTVSKWERGVSEPDLSLLGETASLLGVSLEKLLGVPENGETYAGTFSAEGLGRAIASARKNRGEGQEAVAEAAGVSAGAVSKWERGVICPDAAQLSALAAHFSLPLSALYYGIGEDTPTQTPVQARRARRTAALWAGFAALVCAVAAVLALFFSGGSAPAEKVFSVTVGSAVFEVGENDWFTPPEPSRAGYDFVGFTDCDGESVAFPCKISENCEFTAQFVPHEYEIDYWLNGGSLLSPAENAFTLESGTLELPVPQKAGASFEGWYLAPDYAGEPVSVLVCEGKDVVLYAKWSAVVYTVEYELCGGTLYGSNPSEVTAGSESVLAEPVRRGYDFLGWFDAEEGGERYEKVGGENARNLVLYARWQESGALYSVTYDPCGGTLLGSNPASVGAGEVHALSGAEKAGFSFLGWNTSADGSGRFYDTLYGIREDLALYAVYAPKTYTVVYELDGGNWFEGENPNEIVFGQKVELKRAAKAGHTFLGWFDAEEGGSEVKEINASNLLSVSRLWARYEADSYKISLDGAGGSFFVGEEAYSSFSYTVSYGDTFALPSCTLAGYDFLGWYDAAGALYESIDELNIGDLSLTARYRPAGQTYAVDYVLNGGTQAAGNPYTVAVGQVIPLADPVREGYRFLGWNTQADGRGERLEATPAGREEDLVLYAIWQEYTVSGSEKHFTYEMGQASVTITGYTGAFGENVDLVIPSYIQGRPVAAVEGVNPYADRENDVTRCLHSLTLPSGAVRLGDEALAFLIIEEPLVIPASVREIGRYCFSSSECSLLFEKGSALTDIGEYAFAGIHARNVVVLPDGAETLGVGAFSSAVFPGIVLPETLRCISGGALSAFGGNGTSVDSFSVYIPASVEYVESYAFSGGCDYKYVYLSSAEQAEKFSPDWAGSPNAAPAQVSFISADIGGVTLDYGDRTEYLEGRAFALPSPQKEGYTFLGWYDAETDFVNPLYIPDRDGVVLGAVFEEQTYTDGRSAATRAVLEAGKEYEFILPPCGELYFLPDVGSGKIRITLRMEALGCPGGIQGEKLTVFSDPYGNSVGTGVTIFYEAGDIYCLRAYPGGNYHFRVKVGVYVVD